MVAPLMGAWIEIDVRGRYRDGGDVAPLMGAWLENFPLEA